MKIKESLRDDLLVSAPGRVRFGEPMRLHTSFHIGGPAEIWAEPQEPDQLRALLAVAADAGLTVTMVSGGANLLVRDEGIPGLVVHLSGPGFQTFKPAVPGTGTVPGTDVLAGAALPLEWLIRRAQEAGLSGVEFLAGVPGHVGGAVRMNAGTHDDEGKFHHFGDRVRSLKVMDLAGQVKTLPGEAAGFGYRSSTFLSGWIVLEALLRFTPDDSKEISARVQRLWAFKKRTQDWSAPSAGCIFKNPVQKSVPGTEGSIGTRYQSAGWMVDQVGMKGFRIGGAVVSPRHANFILNDGNARAADVLALVEEVRARVLKQFGVELETEVQITPAHPEPVEG